MASLIKTSYEALLELQLLISTAGTPPDPPLKATVLALFKNNAPISNKSKWSDLTECDFSGYARSGTIAWGAPINEADGSVTTIAPSIQFQLGSNTPLNSQTVFGCALLDTADPPNLLAVSAFDSPVNLVNPNDGFALSVELNQGLGGDLSVVNVIE